MTAGNSNPLTVRGAIQTITKLEGLEIGLFQRTEGITNIVWGLLIPGMFFAYFAMGARYPEAGPYWGPVLWIPWVAAGILSTAVVWRSAHVSANVSTGAKEGLKDGLLHMIVFTLVMFAGFLVFGVFLADEGLRLREPGYMMGLMSLAILVVAMFTRHRATRAARRAHFIVGVLGLVATIFVALASPMNPPDAYFLQTVLGALVLGGGWLASGVYLTLKG